ncbi:EamA/RhaT family transporter [Microvirga sp. KLBC 81]|uniref:DMT family transporter n=1 Tax=Microvirga sp. KLBC 81 TaxID=1862707 RepID=UPI000D5131CA|nr:DMT family transporter [Microvirga sp. KLBC 81]PVE21255.1 EamA/RhaT family transporter [Microvirga sp. KLBC 81]
MRQAKDDHNYYYAAVPLLALLWGLNWPAVKIALGEIKPWMLRAGGMALGGSCLVVIAALCGQSLVVRKSQWMRLAAAGLLSIAAFNILLAFAQLSAPTSRAAIITFTMPIWTVLFTKFLLKEPLDGRRRLGLALGIAGLTALGWPLIGTGEISVGLFYALAAGICWALGTIISKRFPVEAQPLAVAAWQLLTGAVCAAVGMLAFETFALPQALQPATIAALLYHVLFAQALAYVLWFAALSRLPAGTASLGTLMVPAIGVAGAMLLLGERPTLTDLAGLVLMICAASAVLVPPRRT